MEIADAPSRFSRRSIIAVGLTLAVIAITALASGFTGKTQATELTNLQVAMGEKGMLKRGMVNDPSLLSPGLRDQLAGQPVGEHGLVKKGLETTALSPGLAAHLSGAPAGQHDVKAAQAYQAPAPFQAPPAFSAPAYSAPAYSAPAPQYAPPPAMPQLAALSAARPPVAALSASAPVGNKVYGEKGLLKRGEIQDPSQLSPGLLDQLAGAPVGEHGLVKRGEEDLTQVSPGLAAHLAGVAAGQHDAKVPVPGYPGYYYP